MRGLENVPEGAAIFACKHQSAWETTVFYLLADDPAYVLKKELLFIPFWGWVARKCKAIGVDRAGGVGALKRLVKESSAALDANRQVIIFPEGTRMAPGKTRPYHPGIAALYAATEAPVVAVCATTRGLRGNAMATLVASVIRVVCSAAIVSGRKGSCPASGVVAPSKPIASTARAASAIPPRLRAS